MAAICAKTTAVGPSRTVLRGSEAQQMRVRSREFGGVALPVLRHRGSNIKMGRTFALRPSAASSKEVFGMDTSEGLFGFNPFAELWVGRLAMMGFVTSIVEEAVTGRGTLAQIGFDTPSGPLLATLIAVFGGATIVSTLMTIDKAQNGLMAPAQLNRFRTFLGLRNEAKDISESRKTSNDPVRFAMTNDDLAIEKARSAGTAADDFFGYQTVDAKNEVSAMKRGIESSTVKGTSVALEGKADIMEQAQFSSELEYAKEVEIQNGRYAMLGFLAAVLVEAGTGHGIIMQLIDICKMVGLLGSESGF